MFCVILCHNVFHVWPKTTLLFPLWPRDAKRLDTPVRMKRFQTPSQLQALPLALTHTVATFGHCLVSQGLGWVVFFVLVWVFLAAKTFYISTLR